MEREILFRGKRVDNGEWVEGYYSAEEFNPMTCKIEHIPRIQQLGSCTSYGIDLSTVGQYTGLTDKNGVKIFEGDILRSNNNPKDIRQVIFGEFMVIDFETESETDEVTGWYCDVIPTDALSRTRPFCLTLPLTDYYIHQCNMEVVGNIHDNPDMLKGEPNV